MNINKLINSFKYNSLLKNNDVKLLQDGFNKSNINIDLYSVWEFLPSIIEMDSKLRIGHYIFLGVIKHNSIDFLIFLDYIHQIEGIALYDAYINKLSIKNFLSYKKDRLIQSFNFPSEQEELIFKYIYSYFNPDIKMPEFLTQWEIKT